MPSKIQNKMYIVSGGVEATDTLGIYRFQTKRMLNTILRGHVSTLNDIAIEVDTTGMDIEYNKFQYDNYWTCHYNGEDVPLNKCTAVKAIAKINGKWVNLDCNPYSNINDYLHETGYSRILGYGTGWYDKTHKPSFKEIVYTFFDLQYRNILNYDIIENRRIGVIANMKENKMEIWSGEECSFDKIIGEIHVENDEAIVKLHDDTMKFKTYTDPDFIKFITMCVNASYAKRYRKLNIDNKSIDKLKELEEQFIQEDINSNIKYFKRLMDK